MLFEVDTVFIPDVTRMFAPEIETRGRINKQLDKQNNHMFIFEKK